MVAGTTFSIPPLGVHNGTGFAGREILPCVLPDPVCAGAALSTPILPDTQNAWRRPLSSAALAVYGNRILAFNLRAALPDPNGRTIRACRSKQCLCQGKPRERQRRFRPGKRPNREVLRRAIQSSREFLHPNADENGEGHGEAAAPPTCNAATKRYSGAKRGYRRCNPPVSRGTKRFLQRATGCQGQLCRLWPG